MMAKTKLIVFLICFIALAGTTTQTSATDDEQGNWRKYAQQPKGDVYYFDVSRVKTNINLHQVWSRIRYKRSVMGASSYQSLLEIDCSERRQRILQNTFFSDSNWEKPAMNTDTSEKPKRLIKKGSALESLARILCDQ